MKNNVELASKSLKADLISNPEDVLPKCKLTLLKQHGKGGDIVGLRITRKVADVVGYADVSAVSLGGAKRLASMSNGLGVCTVKDIDGVYLTLNEYSNGFVVEELEAIPRLIDAIHVQMHNSVTKSSEGIRKYGIHYACADDVPYKFRRYVIGHDGYTNETDLLQRLTRYDYLFDGFIGVKKWLPDTWNWRSMRNSGFISKEAEFPNLPTEVSVCFKEIDADTFIDEDGKQQKICNYECSGAFIVVIEAGSKSCFDSSDRLYARRQFTPEDEFEAVDWIRDENARILANINQNADHQTAAKQLADAFRNSMLANN